MWCVWVVKKLLGVAVSIYLSIRQSMRRHNCMVDLSNSWDFCASLFLAAHCFFTTRVDLPKPCRLLPRHSQPKGSHRVHLSNSCKVGRRRLFITNWWGNSRHRDLYLNFTVFLLPMSLPECEQVNYNQHKQTVDIFQGSDGWLRAILTIIQRHFLLPENKSNTQHVLLISLAWTY